MTEKKLCTFFLFVSIVVAGLSVYGDGECICTVCDVRCACFVFKEPKKCVHCEDKLDSFATIIVCVFIFFIFSLQRSIFRCSVKCRIQFRPNHKCDECASR